jgi:hypothetical protein
MPEFPAHEVALCKHSPDSTAQCRHQSRVVLHLEKKILASSCEERSFRIGKVYPVVSIYNYQSLITLPLDI